MRWELTGAPRAICTGAVAGLFFVGMVSVASAQTLDPGSTITPIQELTTAPGTLLDSISTTATSSGFGSNSLTFTARAAVYENSTGTLDFYYQVVNSNASFDSVERFTTSSFAGYSTDIFFQPGNSGGAAGFTAGTLLPATADRSTNGSVIGFNFSPPPNGNGKIDPGDTSFTMIVRTNATQYQPGNLAVIDGVATNVEGFAPVPNANLVPEPDAIVLLASGILGSCVIHLRRRRAA